MAARSATSGTGSPASNDLKAPQPTPGIIFPARTKLRPAVCSLLGFCFAVALALGVEPELPASGSTPAAGLPAPTAAAYPPAAYAAMGSLLIQSNHFAELGWSEAQIAAFIEGINGAFHGRTYPFDETTRRVSTDTASQVQEIVTREQRQTAELFAQPGRLKQYMKEASKHFNLQIADSGLGFHIDPGRGGIRPGPNDTVVVSCVATAADGKTKLPQLSATQVRVKVAAMLPGFVEGFQMMTVDSTAVFVLPPALSFGDGDWPQGVDRGTPLIFQVTLHEIIPGGAAP